MITKKTLLHYTINDKPYYYMTRIRNLSLLLHIHTSNSFIINKIEVKILAE